MALKCTYQTSLRRKDRNRKGDGVAIYIRSGVALNPWDDFNHDLLEATFVNILLPKTKPILRGSIYQPQKQSEFYDVLENALEAVSTQSQETIL